MDARRLRSIVAGAAGGAAMAGLLLSAGCSNQDFAAPVSRASDVVDSGKPYLPSNTTDEAARRAEKLARVLLTWNQQKAATVDDYTIGGDDALEIAILALDAPDRTTVLNRSVSQKGSIGLPLLNEVPVLGLTTRAIETRIADGLRGRYLKDPQVSVRVAEYRSLPVVVTGAVRKPGVYYLRRKQSSVLEILAVADGLAESAGDDLLIVRNREAMQVAMEAHAEAAAAGTAGSAAQQAAVAAPAAPVAGAAAATDRPANTTAFLAQPAAPAAATNAEDTVTNAPPDVALDLAAVPQGDVVNVDLRGLLDDGDVRLNVPIRGGDIISVPPRKKLYIYVLGYVQRPGAYELHDNAGRVRALDAVAMAGGLGSAARAENSYMIIENEEGRKVVPVDLTKIARGVRPPVYMEPGTTLVVGSGFWAKMGEFIKPSVGASVSPVP